MSVLPGHMEASMTPVLENSSSENCDANRAAGRWWPGWRLTPWHGALTLGLAMLLALPLGFANAQTAMAPDVKSDAGTGIANQPSNGADSAASKTQKPGQTRAQHGKSQSRGHRAATPPQKKAPAPTNAEPFVDTTEHASLQATPVSPTNKQAALAYGQLASAFEPNRGQANSQVKFLTRGRGFSLFLTPDGAVLSMSAPASSSSDARERKSDQLTMHLEGAKHNLQPVGVNELPGKTNYFIGKDPGNWRANIPTYSDVKYKGVYPGVDLVYHGNQKELEYDFFVAPAADPQAIHLKLAGHALKIDSHGDLIIKTDAGEVRFRKPTIYELSASGSSNSNSKHPVKRPVNGGYVLLADNEVGFKLGAYDRSKTLVIDPVLVYSTLVGGSQHDEARGIAVDSTGAAYITGWTSSSDFPISAGAYNGTFTGGGNSNSDIFVTKLNPGGASIAYSTYIGGSEDDIANAIAIDTNGNAYVTGETYSPNFPTVSAYQDSCSSTCSSSLADAFLFVLGGDGSALLYSTYFGGNGIDRGFGVAVSGTNAYVYGQTIAAGQTENFPTTTGVYQTAYGGGNSDAFVAEFNTATSGTPSLVYSTYLGGSGDEDYNGAGDNTRKGGIAVDGNGDAWVTGFTTGGFPTIAGAYQSTFQGGGSVTNSDAFVTELNPAGTALLYSSYFGGSGDDLAYGITHDSSNNVYITGSTSSMNLPVTSTAFQPTCPTTCATNFNGFLTVLTPSGDPAALKYSTYLAGTNNGTSIQDGGQAITIDSSLNAYVTGGTAAANLATTGSIQSANAGGNDVFVAELATTGTAATFPEIFATYLGGLGDDFGQGIALDTTGNIYVAGYTNSTSTSPFFPTTTGAFQTGCGDLGTCNGKTDAFVAEINTANFSLTTTVTGSGSIGSTPAGISCPGTCAFNFPTASVVTLTPTANSGFTFTGWTSACSGTGACSVTMNSDQTVGATFSAAFLLNVGEAGTGTGTVVDNVTPTPLLNCQPNCTANYAGGTVITLTATAGPNSTFAGWSGACSGTGSCVVTMSQAQSVTATFNLTAGAAAACPATGTDNWTGGAGNWSNSAMWSNGVPTATTSVCINSGVGGGDTVTADSQTPTSGTLFIGANSTVIVGNNNQLTLNGNITNLGLIEVDASSSGTWLNIAGSLTLTGGGQVVLTSVNALIRRPSGTSVLTNVNNRISGTGDIGNNGMTLINQAAGVVNANTTAGNLSIDAPSSVNSGLVEATGAGHLVTTVTFNNAGGTFTAGGSSIVELDNPANIQGGTLNGIGTFEGIGSTAQIDGSTEGPTTITGTFTIANSAQVNFLGTINNTGTIAIASTGAGTWMNIVGPVTLTGGGSVTLSNPNALIRRPSGTSILTNVNNTIAGQGDIGNNALTFINQSAGVVNANVALGTLSIDAASITNHGLLEATNAGVLQINDTVENGGAAITAGTQSTVNLINPAVIEGGTITAAPGALFEGSNSTATLDGSSQGALTIDGIFTIVNNAQTNFIGTIVNTGTIDIASTGAGTWMNIVGPVTLTGGGSVTMGNPNALIRRPSGTSILTNVNNNISGFGDIGNNALTFINQSAGVVNANALNGTLSIDAVSAVNQGVLESTGGGILQISVPIVNAGATITAGSGSTVNFLNGSQIEGGTISAAAGTSPGMMIGVGSTPVLDGSTQGTLTIAGTYQIQNNGQTNFMGMINNTGSIIIDSTGAGTWMNIVGTVTLTGGGTVSMTNPNALIRRPSGASVLINGNNTISGSGDIGNNGLSFTNQGTVNANDPSGSTLQIDATPFSNQGLVEKTGPGVLNIVQPLTNSGVIFPDGSPVPGAITDTQTYTQVTGGSLDIAIGTVNATTVNSVLNVTGAATLAGNLNVSLFGGFTPANGNSFTVLTASSITGTFASINAPALTGGLAWSATYNPTSVVLNVGPGSSSDTLTVSELGTGNGEVSDPSGAIQCTEDNGVITPGSNCSASFSGGTVTLTAMPMGSPLSTFAGWGGACAFAGTSTTCAVPLTLTTSVTANFIAPPQTQTFNLTPGINVVSTAGFDCPNNPNPISPTNPCTAAQGPNAHSFEFSLPQVLQPFTMVVTATEFQADGLCPQGGSVTNPTDFDCRFATFFNYGTDTNGNTITPLCNPYAHGNCVHYDIYYCVPQASGPCIPTPGQEPPPRDYVNIVNLKITWNSDTFAPPSPTYAGSLPRLFDDPDYAFTPTSPYGTICGDLMVEGPVGSQISEPYSCQFEFDVTSFFNPIEPVDAGIGGTIRQFNDLVVAFPPTATGSNPIVTPPTPSAPTLSGSCVTGCSTNSNNVAFASGSGGVFQLTPTGYPAPTVTESGALPAGLVFNTETGVLSGTPAAGTAGSYPITLSASNGVGSPAVENLVIVVDQTPSITSNNSTTFTVGTNGSFQVTATGFPAPTFSETGALPNNVTLSPTGLLSGTPAAGTSGTYPITITATNGIGSGATQSFTLNVVAGSQAPAITSANNTTFTAGTNGSFQVVATGSPSPTFSEAGALPSNVTLSSTGLLSGVPAAGTGGTYTITITASNGVLPNATQQFTLTVDQAPAITSTNSTTFTIGTNGSFQVTTTGFAAATFSEPGALPTNVIFSPIGVLSSVAAANTAGAYPITKTASNGVSPSATQSFTFKVVAASQGPVITSGNSTTFTVGANGSFQVTATGSPAPTFSETGALPSNVTLSSSGLLSGVPVAGTGGTYPIVIKATNSTGSTTQSFTLTVDQPPAITSANSATFTVGTNSSFQVTATGFPAVTFTETGSLPNNVTLSPNGLLSGTPAAGTNGSYPITITASNGVNPAAQQSFTLVVNPSTTSTLTISPSSVNFGNVSAGTLGFRQVTLTNTGRSSITISDVQVTSGIQAQIAISSSGDFVALSLCPRTLAAGRSCVVELTFFAKGSNYNPQSAELVITDSAPGSPQTVPLTATIINLQAKLSANAINFSTERVGTTSAAKSVTVTNTGTTNLVFNSITASGNFALAPAATNSCSITVPVAPKSSCVISVTFAPTARGIRTGTVTLKDNVLFSPQVIGLTGVGN